LNSSTQNNRFVFFLFLIDFLAITSLFVSILYFRYSDWFIGFNVFEITKFLINYQIKSYLFLLISWFLISQYLGFYKFIRFERYLDYFRKSAFQIILFAVVLFAISGVKNENLFSNKQSLYFVLILGLYIFPTRTVFFFVNKRNRVKGLNHKNIIIIGQNKSVDSLIDLIKERKDFGLCLTAHFVVNNPKENQKILNIESLKRDFEKETPDYLYLCLNSGLDNVTINEITNLAESLYISIGFIPDNVMDSMQSLEINYLDSFPILIHKKYPLDHTFNQFTKRVFDIVFAVLIFAVLLWWLLPILSIAVFFSQGRPIFYAQKRNGLNGKEFDCLKFRTMRPDKSNDKKPTERDDPRVTKLGKILRKTSLDELPQFFNVLKGDMSIVGPRPHMVSENESYAEIIKKYSLRHYVKPGITGLAQIRGYRGAIDSEKDMELRVRTDIYYVRNWSFLLDLLIIYKTVRLIVVGDENAI